MFLGLEENAPLRDFASLAEENAAQNQPPSATLSSHAVATGGTSHVSSAATTVPSIPSPVSTEPTSNQAASTLNPSLSITISEGGPVNTCTIEPVSPLSQPSQLVEPLLDPPQPVMQLSQPPKPVLPLSPPSRSTSSTSLHLADSSEGTLKSSASSGRSTMISLGNDNSYVPPSLTVDTSRKKAVDAESRVVPLKLLKIGGRSVFVLKQIDKKTVAP